MVSIPLLVISITLPIIILAISILFVIKFSHPDDDSGFAPKIITIICLTWSGVSLVIVPLDVANNNVVNGGGLKTDILQIIALVLIFALVLVIIPFTNIFFDSAFTGSTGEFMLKRLKHSLIGTFIVLAVYFILVIIFYFSMARSANINFAKYSFAIFTFLNYFPFCIFVATGLASLPLDLFFGQKNRPTQSTLEEYQIARTSVGQRAKRLRETGEKMLSTLKSEYFSKNRGIKNQFEQAVFSLREDYRKIQICYHLKGGNPLQPQFKLVLSVITAVMSITQILQICLVVLTSYKFRFLDKFFEVMKIENFAIFDLIAFVLQSLYLLQASTVGMIKLGLYIPFITSIRPLEQNNTYSDSFLVNTAIILSSCAPNIHLCVIAFKNYVKDTEIYKYFSEVETQSMFKFFFGKNVFCFVIVIVQGIMLAILIFYPPNPTKKIEGHLHDIASKESKKPKEKIFDNTETKIKTKALKTVI